MNKNVYSFLYDALIESEKEYIRNTTPEERELHKRQQEERQLERQRVSDIRGHVCPSCKGKLIKGKKNKKNEYKREYKCQNCDESHYI